MRKLVILFDTIDMHGSPFDLEMYLEGYRELHNRFLKRNVKVIFARGGPNAYIGQSRFTNCSTFEGSTIVKYEDTFADAVLDKSKYFVPEEKLNCINHRRIKEICGDKVATYELFKSLSPHTEVITTPSQLKTVVSAMPETVIVLKPNFGSAGKGVVIDAAKNIDIATIEFPVLMQEYIDSSAGIEGLVDGIHDLRVVVANGKIIFSFIRTPGKGSYLAGLATGGTVTPIALSQIPDKVLSIKELVEHEFSFSEKRLYSIDLAYNGDEYKLIELNSQPGISSTSFKQEYEQLHEGIIELVCSII